MSKPFKHIGIVTLYRPNLDDFVHNCLRYLPYLDRLVIWINADTSSEVLNGLRPRFAQYADRIEWEDSADNRCIAPAINHALCRAEEMDSPLMLVMDQDSYWLNFEAYLDAVDSAYEANPHIGAWAPYVYGCYDKNGGQRFFAPNLINSGTIFNVSALRSVGGADPLFPLDGLDNDIAFRLREAGYLLECLPMHELKHTLGNPMRSRILHIYSTNYNATRTYSVTRGQLLVIKRHHRLMSWSEIWNIVREYIFWKLVRICLVEPDKWNRFRAFLRGIRVAACTPVNTPK